ncbi:MAG: hypothetical protein ACI9XU_002182 [Arenicella sp.]
MSDIPQSRRGFLKTSGLTFAFTVAGVSIQLTPAQAREKRASLNLLTELQATTLDYLAEAIVPGASKLGIVHFLDSQLSTSPKDSLLMLKYLGVPSPHLDFYSAGLDSTARAAKDRYDKSLDRLSPDQLEELISDISTDKVVDWQGPPASFFYFVLRSDAVDTVYGTQAGFKSLEIPYMAHIQPPTNW